jgi:hypothetical protein
LGTFSFDFENVTLGPADVELVPRKYSPILYEPFGRNEGVHIPALIVSVVGCAGSYHSLKNGHEAPLK